MLKKFFQFLLVLVVVVSGGQLARFVDLAQAAPVGQVVSDHIVISEFRTRGPSGASDEFVEIFNPTASDIDISGWQLLGSNSSGATSIRATVPSSTVLGAGKYYLFANSAGYSIASVPADVIYSTGLTDDGGIALYNPSSLAIIDQAGMNFGSAYKEGGTLTPLTTNVDRAYERKYGGSLGNCLDTNDNTSDFFEILPSNPQNSNSPSVGCSVPTATFTPTSTATATVTLTPTITPTSTATPVYPALSLLINEVAWAGTSANSSDEWIELYNPTSQKITLTGWVLKSAGASPALNIALTGEIAAGGFFLLERGSDNNVSNIPADQIYTGTLSNDGDTLSLIAPDGVTVVDTANLNPNNAIDRWPAGSGSPNYASMERRAVVADNDTAWFTYASALVTAYDANSNPIKGSPRAANWAFSVTSTPFPTPTRTRTPTPTRVFVVFPTRTPTPVADVVVINEFLPRAASDWNKDGETNLRDEYIELINIGVQPVNLRGWRLNHIFGGNYTFLLPEVIIQPDEKVVFFGTDTNIILSDGGGTVRLLKPNGIPFDAVTYTLVLSADRSWCRMPDGRGAWSSDCQPTLRRSNEPSPGSGVATPVSVSTPVPRPSYPIPESCPVGGAPGEIVRAECDSPGLGMANPKYVYKYSKP